MSDDEAPKIQIDDDWKAQAQAEKERLSEQSKSAEGEAASGGAGSPGAPGDRQMPEANFETLLSTMATQALFAMGAIPDPATGQRVAHLDLARHHIDMLGVIEEKTKGSLSEDETSMLTQTIYELRSRYIQLSTQARNG